MTKSTRRWYTGDETASFKSVDASTYVDPNGRYYHSDETHTECYGPFVSLEAARDGLERYVSFLGNDARYLDGGE